MNPAPFRVHKDGLSIRHSISKVGFSWERRFRQRKMLTIFRSAELKNLVLVVTSECAGPMGLGLSRGAPWPSHQQPLSSSRTQNISRRLRAHRALRPSMTRQMSPVRLSQPILLAMEALFRLIWRQASSNSRRNIGGGKTTAVPAEAIGRQQGLVTRHGKSIFQEAHLPTLSLPCHGLRHGSPLNLFLCNITPRPSIRWSRVFLPTQLNGSRFSTSSPDTRRA